MNLIATCWPVVLSSASSTKPKVPLLISLIWRTGFDNSVANRWVDESNLKHCVKTRDWVGRKRTCCVGGSRGKVRRRALKRGRRPSGRLGLSCVHALVSSSVLLFPIRKDDSTSLVGFMVTTGLKEFAATTLLSPRRREAR